MAGTLTRGPTFRYGKADRGPDRDPVGVFASDVAAVNDVYRENLVGPITHACLQSRPYYAGHVSGACLAECLDGPSQDVGEFPVETDTVGQIMPVDRLVPKPTAIDVDPHGFGEPKRRRHHRKSGEIFARERVERAAGIKRKTELSDAGRNQVSLHLGSDRRTPVALGARPVG